MPRKHRRYLVGFDQDNQTVYGKDGGDWTRWADPLTLTEARKMFKSLDTETPKRIYKLVPVRAEGKEKPNG